MILEACTRIREPAVLATVVQVRGSAYRRPGARMLIAGDGTTHGMVSGGCLELDLAERAREVSDQGASRTVVYDMRSPDDIVWGLGLGCDGEVRVLLERLEPAALPAWLGFVAERRARRRDSVVVTVFESDVPARIGCRLWTDGTGTSGGTTGSPDLDRRLLESAAVALDQRRSTNATWRVEGDHATGLVEWVPPPVQLLVFGAGTDAEPLVAQATELGWRVAVYDQRDAFADPARFPRPVVIRCIDYAAFDIAATGVDERTAILLMTHHFPHDRTLLGSLLEVPAAYIGVLGPRRRLERLLGCLDEDGLRPSESARRRLHGPVGLDIGSETPAEIALSALAEIQAILSGRSGGHLCSADRPLHDWPR